MVAKRLQGENITLVWIVGRHSCRPLFGRQEYLPHDDAVFIRLDRHGNRAIVRRFPDQVFSPRQYEATKVATERGPGTDPAQGRKWVVRQTRIAIFATLLIAGLLGAFWVAAAQEGRAPWPPPPVRFEDGGSAPPAVPPPLPPKSGTTQSDAKGPSADKKPGAIRKLLSGVLPASAQEPAKPPPTNDNGPVRHADVKDGGQEIPPPTPPKLSVPPAVPSAADTGARPMESPRVPPPDLPPIPALPGDVNSSIARPAPAETKGSPSVAPVIPPVMPAADPPVTDPAKSVITDPVKQTQKPAAFILYSQKRAPAPGTAVSPSVPQPILGTAQEPLPPAQPSVSRSVDSPQIASAAALAVQVSAPASVATGRPATFDVAYANTGTHRLTGLVLHVMLSDGLRHPVGQSIEADVGDLEPGGSKSVKVTAAAVGPGRQGVQVRIAAMGGPEAAAQAALDVVSAATGLTVQQASATRLFLGRTADLRIEVTNHSAKPMRHVSVVSHLPEGVEFVAASDRGLYQPSGKTVNWLLDPLGPGQTQALLLRVQARSTGQFSHMVVARAQGLGESKSSALLGVEGIADLAVDLQGENALELGRETIYEVRVANPGSGPNTNVRVEMAFAPGLLPRSAQGPSSFRVDGQNVVFEGLPLLAAQGQTVYRVLAVGQSPGDQRIRVGVTSDQVRTPATRETGTRVYRD
jgi:hypothetical protein